MPSALVAEEGDFSFGYSYVPPYNNYNVRFQYTSRLEITGSYRVFRGIDDPVLSAHGFGDFSDKGANVKFVLLFPEETDYRLPGIAIGWDDFLGTRGFESKYAIATQVIPDYDLDISLGFGVDRISGFFGGINWTPFRKCRSFYLQGISLTAEYDGINYDEPESEPHKRGRLQDSKVNYGLKYKLGDYWGLSLAHVRGRYLAGSAYVAYNFGQTEGIVAKINAPLPYCGPDNHESLGYKRPNDVLKDALVAAFKEQGFKIFEIHVKECPSGNKEVYIRATNKVYWEEPVMREALIYILAGLAPENVEEIFVNLEEKGLPVQRYRYKGNDLIAFREKKISQFELETLNPPDEFCPPCGEGVVLIYKKNRSLAHFGVSPRSKTLFGSAQGKFKFQIGIGLDIDGLIADAVYYKINFGYPLINYLQDARDRDMLNPSQLINVRSDTINYLKPRKIGLIEGYLQKHWNMGCGFYSRIAGGYFEEAYGGMATEFLYYPVGSHFAAGFEGAVVKKREYTGFDFVDEIRKLQKYVPTYQHFLGQQYFVDLYYSFPQTHFESQVTLGRFLAKDWGAKFELARHFKSGLTLSIWYTWTTAKDFVNGDRYFDKGVAFSMPIDNFFTYRTKRRWGYGMSAWQRDIGARSATGLSLYELIRNERFRMNP